MREFARIQRIIDLTAQLWTYDSTLPLGELLEKWIWNDWIESKGDIFHPEDTTTEQRLKDALFKAQTELSLTPYALSPLKKSIVDKITEIWPHVPDQRFGQFLSNYAFGHFLNHPPKMMLRQSDEMILGTLQQHVVRQTSNADESK